MCLTYDNWQIPEDEIIGVLAEHVEEDTNSRNEEDEEKEPKEEEEVEDNEHLRNCRREALMRVYLESE